MLLASKPAGTVPILLYWILANHNVTSELLPHELRSCVACHQINAEDYFLTTGGANFSSIAIVNT